MIPTFDQLLRPILAAAVTKPITRRTAAETMVRQFQLTAEEAAQRIPSGGLTLIGNRAGWAMSVFEPISPPPQLRGERACMALNAHSLRFKAFWGVSAMWVCLRAYLAFKLL